MSTQISSLSIFMPAYNEEANIKNTIEDAINYVSKYTDDFEIIVVNDGSIDDTAAIVKQLSKQHPQVRLVNHRQNKGYGAAVKSGLKACKKDWIFFTDSDGQFKFDELETFIQARDKNSLTIGYRKKRMDPFHRVFIAQVLLKLWNLILFGLRVRDVDCAYKLFPKTVVSDTKLNTESAITVTEFLVKSLRAGYKIHQLPVTHYPRQFGEQTGGNWKVILRATRESFKLFLELHNAKTK